MSSSRFSSAQWTFTDMWYLCSMPYFSPIVPGVFFSRKNMLYELKVVKLIYATC